MKKDTETLDRIYLEWSQFTSARNAREIAAENILREIMALMWNNGEVVDLGAFEREIERVVGLLDMPE